MSTRCNVIIQDTDVRKRQVCAYRHSDGYPSCTGIDLEYILKNLASRNKLLFENIVTELVLTDGIFEFDGFGIHGDIEFLYTITVFSNYTELKCESIDFDDNKEEIFIKTFIVPNGS